MRALLALASAVVGAAAAANWQALSRCDFISKYRFISSSAHTANLYFRLINPLSFFGVTGSTAGGQDHGTLDSIVDKLAQRIASAQPHVSPSVVVLPSSASVVASPIWTSAVPFGLIAASSFAASRYFGWGQESVSSIAQVRCTTPLTFQAFLRRSHCPFRQVLPLQWSIFAVP